MKIEDIVKKTDLGISQLTGALYLYYKRPNGMKVKKQLTSNIHETISLLKEWLSIAENYEKEDKER